MENDEDTVQRQHRGDNQQPHAGPGVRVDGAQPGFTGRRYVQQGLPSTDTRYAQRKTLAGIISTKTAF